jgi:cytochrome c5
MRKHLFLVFSAVLLVVAASLVASMVFSPEERPDPTQAPLPPPKGFRAEMLADTTSPGAVIFIKTCPQCHDLPNPRMHAAEEWPPVVFRMVDRLIRRKTFSMAHKPLFLPGDAEYPLLIAYLQKNGLRKASAQWVTDRSPDAVLFNARCTQCHSLPDPTLHTAAEWPGVIDRMRRHVSEFKRMPISDAEKERLVSFLSQARPPATRSEP